MGRSRFKKKKGQQNAQGQQNQQDSRDTGPVLVKENEEFELFYKHQKLLPEEHWSKFMTALATPLPTTFRVTGAASRGEAMEFMRILQRDYFPALKDMVIDGEKIEEPSPLCWYPLKDHAWQLNLGRSTLRKHPLLGELHACIRTATDSGHVSRQEAVSMIPPLLLDVKSYHKVLDMCAAPGSKTAQLIEMLHDGCDTIPEGYVIANDVDNSRCYTMTHQVKRLQSPCVVVINENAASMPAFLQKPGQSDYVYFDRILADVPCSGDGTMRKNLDIWRRWNSNNGRGLHSLQRRILLRGLRMLAVGGKLVYSTCSFNPLENESVVAAALRTFGDCVELVDVADRLPGLNRVPGMTTWSVLQNADGTEATLETMSDQVKKKHRQSMYPPTEEELKKFALDRCIRVLPHHNDTGGFFIAVLHKNADSSAMKAEVQDGEDQDTDQGNEDTADGEKSGEPPQKKRRFHGFKEDPFFFFKDDEEVWPSVRDFYQLTDDFPYNQFLARCEGAKKRNIYFSSAAVRQFMDANAERFKVINLGVKALSRSDTPYSDCQYRLTQDAICVLSQFVKKRVVRLEARDITTVLATENPFVEKLSQSAQDQLKPLKQGGLIFQYRPDGGEGPQCSLTVCGWKGLTSVRSFTPKQERLFYLLLCGQKEFLQKKPSEKRIENLKKAAQGNGEGSSADQGNEEESSTQKEESTEESNADK